MRSRSTLSRRRRTPGFALVVSLTLMVLLSLLAVGLLSLASVTLRQSTHTEPMAAARANARLALVLALGELQSQIGVDRAITAPSDLVTAGSGRRHLTGVWDSWDVDPTNGAPDYDSEKDRRFRRWLVSDADRESLEDPGYPMDAAPADSIELIAAGDDDDRVLAGRVALPDDQGAYAWHVADESLKARVDTMRDPRADTLARKRSLLAGHRSGTRFLTRPDGSSFGFLPGDDSPEAFREALPVVRRLTGLNQVDLLAGDAVSAETRHDLTTHSLGLLTDVRKGGLKRDLTCAFEAQGGLPAELGGRRLYESTLGVDGDSDPFWSALSGYYNSYKELGQAEGVPTYRLSSLQPVEVDGQVVPEDYLVTPVIAKVEILFTFVVRDTHGPWVSRVPAASGDNKRNYMLHMVYLPIVTLHNPYNVALEFERMKLVLRDIPVAFNFYVNGQRQNDRLVPFNEMFIVNTGGAAGEKAFHLDLADWTYAGQARPSQPLRMEPGQTLVCGPYLDPAAGSIDTLRGHAGLGDKVGSDPSVAIKLRPGFSGKAVGISVDWLTPPEFETDQSSDGRLGVLGLRLNDRIRIESAVRRPLRGVQDRWELDANMMFRNRNVPYGGLRFDYSDEATLLEHFDRVHTYPVTGDLRASEIYEPYGKPLAAQNRAQAVVAFSACARTCNGGVYETGSRDELPGALNEQRDGRLAGKPFLHHNPSRSMVSIDLKRDEPGRFSHELNFQPLKGELDDVLEIDARNRGAALTGNTTISGIKSGALFDLPSGPMQTLAGFRRSNALSSTYLPNFLQPLANSAASPLIDTGKVVEEGLAEYPLLDHSWLANHALYDGFYFSTACAADGRSATDRFQSFLRSESPLDNQCYQPWRPEGAAAGDLAARLFAGSDPAPEAWREIAACQMVKGPFNVNSTRVLAWKALLSSLQGTPIPVCWAKSLDLESVVPVEAPVTGLSLPLGGLATSANPDPNKVDNRRTNEWNGYRTLSTGELDELAERIVEEVRDRGPFLSMSEFVNRRLGPTSDQTLGGALHRAIEKSAINGAVFDDMVPVRTQDVLDPDEYGFATPEAATGNPAEGAPGWITQGDLLQILEPRATVRSDTFVIRTCGQALDGNGRVIASAYAEAVVQRTPEYLDPATPPAARPGTDAMPEVNRRFGRRLEVVSFRWVPSDELRS